MTDRRYVSYWSTMKQYIDLVFSDPDCVDRSKPYDYGYLMVVGYSIPRDNFSSQFYEDLTKHIRNCIYKLKIKIDTAQFSPTPIFLAQRSLGNKYSKVGARNVFKAFHEILPEFLQNIKRVVDWCFHLNEKYVKKTLNTDLRTEFLKLFCSEVIDEHIDTLLQVARSNHTHISSQMKASVLSHLLQINPEYTKKDPNLFVYYWL